MIDLSTTSFAIALSSEIISKDNYNIFFHTFLTAIGMGILFALIMRSIYFLWK